MGTLTRFDTKPSLIVATCHIRRREDTGRTPISKNGGMNPVHCEAVPFSHLASGLIALDSALAAPRKPFLPSRVVIGLLAIVPAPLRFECA